VSETRDSRPVISGIGKSTIGRRLGRSAMDLTLDAVLAAIDDAGLNRSDIDGVVAGSGYAPSLGASPIQAIDIKEALRLEVNWYGTVGADTTQMSGLIHAYAAVASGQARHVIVSRTVVEASMREAAVVEQIDERVTGPGQWAIPLDAPSSANWVALIASRYFFEFGTTREQLAQIALTCRRNAGLTEDAVYREALTLDDYLGSRMISSPLCLYDCDVPIDGSMALIVSPADFAKDARGHALRVESICGPLHGRESWDQQVDLTRFCGADAGRRLWSQTDLTPKDLDLAQIYDGYSFLAMLWLEDMGICGRGEAGAFIEGGSRIALDGELPINTAGGQLSFGRMHGMGLIHEACVQLRGEGGKRQVANNPSVALVTNGGGSVASAALLVRD
jgi:acetyl-CoA acetyltransferase